MAAAAAAPAEQYPLQQQFQVDAIGVVRSPFKQKFGIPRQPGLAPAAEAELELLQPYTVADLAGIEQHSHLWITFVFHLNNRSRGAEKHGRERGRVAVTVRPPRLGGSARLGVFATRATFRPNPIGLSVVSLLGVTERGPNGRPVLRLGEIDLVDGTPVLDVRPYDPALDRLEHARAAFAPEPPLAVPVEFSAAARAQLAELEGAGCYHRSLGELVVQVLQQDPRPATRGAAADDNREYGMHLYDLNVTWRMSAVGGAVVTALDKLAEQR